jgi:hypothetical protein
MAVIAAALAIVVATFGVESSAVSGDVAGEALCDGGKRHRYQHAVGR